ncbi:MAG: phage shock protein operon transcriptional activator, partial [Rhodospirillales bacterium]|nr:phage shock protein operon transcriptional activator [Rhodospirillales bacterium]
GWTCFPGFTRAALDALLTHPWPGNVRELKNAAERSVYRAADPAEPIDTVVLDPFQSSFRPPAEVPAEAPAGDVSQPFAFTARVEAYEKDLLQAALARCRHNQRRTAQHLGLSYHQLRHHLRKYGFLPEKP